jgi:DNA-binding NarL/FixJ family response regulator
MKTKKATRGGKASSNENAGKRRVVIIDDHPLVRQGLVQLINLRSGHTVIGEADTAARGLEIVRKEQPDLVIMDMSLPQSDGLELVKQIKSEFPRLPMLIISMHDERVYAERVLRAGARGYLMKKEPSEKVFQAIDNVLRGEIFVSDRVKQDMLEYSATGRRPFQDGGSPLDHLSDRELQVFQLLGNGIPTREIAQQLHLSVKTIECYRENLKVKMNLRSGAELVQRAIQWSKSQPTASS